MISLDDGIESASSLLLFSIFTSVFHICQLGLSKKQKKNCFLLLRGFRPKVWRLLTLYIFGLEWLSMMFCICVSFAVIFHTLFSTIDTYISFYHNRNKQYDSCIARRPPIVPQPRPRHFPPKIVSFTCMEKRPRLRQNGEWQGAF